MNFVFFSPHFPSSCTDFCHHLKREGANVLGIGDAPYEALSGKLRDSLTEYYRIADMEDYDQVLRAVGHLTHRHGKIDRFESLNEHWLELEARIRTDFNIAGTKLDFIDNLKHKSRMKAFFERSGVDTARHHEVRDYAAAQDFVRSVGYPVVAKPDEGSGAANTYKITSDAEFDAFFAGKPAGVEFILQEFIDGIVVTYDGLVDRDGRVVFAASHRFEQSIMQVVNNDHHLFYFGLPEVEPAVAEAGQRILRGLDIRERFFHIEFFKTHKDGRIIALEINMRPPGGWMTDAINFTHDMDVYREWASMVVHNRVGGPFFGKYFTGYASRKRHIAYRYDHRSVLDRWGGRIVRHDPIEAVFGRAMGHYAYQFRAASLDEVRAIQQYIQAEEA